MRNSRQDVYKRQELQVMKKPRLTTIFSMILIFAGISLALYPTISNILAPVSYTHLA